VNDPEQLLGLCTLSSCSGQNFFGKNEKFCEFGVAQVANRRYPRIRSLFWRLPRLRLVALKKRHEVLFSTPEQTKNHLSKRLGP
jgi:hypothetical protein